MYTDHMYNHYGPVMLFQQCFCMIWICFAGNAPRSGQWPSSGSQSVGSGQVIQRQTDRWPASSSTTAHSRPSLQPQRPMQVINKPLMQSTPASQTFLASAANIMMGVGLAANRTQEPRFDAYSNMSGGNIRRY